MNMIGLDYPLFSAGVGYLSPTCNLQACQAVDGHKAQEHNQHHSPWPFTHICNLCTSTTYFSLSLPITQNISRILNVLPDTLRATEKLPVTPTLSVHRTPQEFIFSLCHSLLHTHLCSLSNGMSSWRTFFLAFTSFSITHNFSITHSPSQRNIPQKCSNAIHSVKGCVLSDILQFTELVRPQSPLMGTCGLLTTDCWTSPWFSLFPSTTSSTPSLYTLAKENEEHPRLAGDRVESHTKRKPNPFTS